MCFTARLWKERGRRRGERGAEEEEAEGRDKSGGREEGRGKEKKGEGIGKENIPKAQ